MSSQLTDAERAELMPSELCQHQTPIPTQIVSSDEFYPDPQNEQQREVESRLLAHDAVSQVVVVAAPDADGLEKPVAYVVRAAGAEGSAATEAELIDFCRAALPSFKRPRKVVFVDAYPTTATGKIRRVELRAEAATVLTG